MTADDAGQSWLNRTSDIIAEYKAATDDTTVAQVHMEGVRASAGISALFENRGSELSQRMIDYLNQAVDALAQVNNDSLAASYESPWSAAADGFGHDVGQNAQAGWDAVKGAPAKAYNWAKDEVEKAKDAVTGPLALVAVAVVALLLIVMIANKRIERVVT